MPDITLYTYALDPFGAMVYWVLQYKRARFSLVHVNPANQHQISFTEQKTIPVLKVGEQWKTGAKEICSWLDELIPDRPVCGRDAREQHAIQQADKWVNERLLALAYRTAIDWDERGISFRNGRKLAKVMRATSDGVPWYAQFFWSRIMRKTPFFQSEAILLDADVPLLEWRERIRQELEGMLRADGWITGTAQPGFADFNAFAQFISGEIIDFEARIDIWSSPRITGWMSRMRGIMPDVPEPQLVPGWKLPDCW